MPPRAALKKKLRKRKRAAGQTKADWAKSIIAPVDHPSQPNLYQLSWQTQINVPKVDIDDENLSLERSIESLKALKIAFIRTINTKVEELIEEHLYEREQALDQV